MTTALNPQIVSFLQENETQMFSLLEDLVVIQSSSHNKVGVDRVARAIETFLSNSSAICRTVTQEHSGNHLVIRSPAAEADGRRQALLVGHMDTVFPQDTAFNWYKEDEHHSYGPGVIDMKGGLVVGLFALSALDAAGLLSEIPITFICNADEEIGSGTSGAMIRKEARHSAFAFVLECGGLNGEVVTGRKGNLSAKIDVTGEAGHAAFAGQDKASAILELAHKTIALEALNAPERGITVNVGQVQGGIGPNTVPALASARIDMRFLTLPEGSALEKHLKEIVAHQQVPNTAATCQVLTGRPPMPKCDANHNLYEIVQAVASDLGYYIQPEFRQGVSDANLIAAENVPVIDGLGPLGGRDHSEEEYMIKSSLLQRTILLACAIPACYAKYSAQSH